MAGQSLPRAGHVSQLRQNWTVYEDEALATKIQHEEINHHYQGNKSRNQQIRADLPQAKEIQSHEIEEAQEKIHQYRRQLQAQSEADSKLALELALAHKSGFLHNDEEYTRKRDELFARNLQDLEIRYRLRQAESATSNLPYNDTEYSLKVAKPAIVTEEPLYANNVEEHLMSEIGEVKADSIVHRPLSRISADHHAPSSLPQPASSYKSMGGSFATAYNSMDAHSAGFQSMSEVNAVSSYISMECPMGAVAGNSSQQAQSSYKNMDGLTSKTSPGLLSAAQNFMESQPSSSYNRLGAAAYNSNAAPASYSNMAPPTAAYGSRGPQSLPPYSNMGTCKRNENLNTSSEMPTSVPSGSSHQQRRDIEELNTSSDYVTSSRTSDRSDSSMTSYSELGACGGAYSIESPMPDDVIGIRSALSPDEIEAAEAAERLLEQERKDAELALRLQEELELSGEDANQDRKLALEAQDREFARVLQAKEKAKARRAKEKARQRKLERQRQEAERLETLESSEAVPEGFPDGRLSRGDPEGRLPRGDGAQSRQSTRESQISPRNDPSSPSGLSSRVSPRSPELNPPARKPYVHTEAIDSHMNDTYCKTQITPTQSISSENSEPQYANLDERGKPLKTEPILHLPSSKTCDKISPRQSAMNEDMPIPPYMPMQSSASRKSEDMERKIKKKKEKEGCKQQ